MDNEVQYKVFINYRYKQLKSRKFIDIVGTVVSAVVLIDSTLYALQAEHFTIIAAKIYKIGIYYYYFGCRVNINVQ